MVMCWRHSCLLQTISRVYKQPLVKKQMISLMKFIHGWTGKNLFGWKQQWAIQNGVPKNRICINWCLSPKTAPGNTLVGSKTCAALVFVPIEFRKSDSPTSNNGNRYLFIWCYPPRPSSHQRERYCQGEDILQDIKRWNSLIFNCAICRPSQRSVFTSDLCDQFGIMVLTKPIWKH